MKETVREIQEKEYSTPSVEINALTDIVCTSDIPKEDKFDDGWEG